VERNVSRTPSSQQGVFVGVAGSAPYDVQARAISRFDLGEHGELRADERLFLVASGHVVEGVDEFVKKRDRYDLAALSQNR
jgi:hypothetical protein